MGDSRAMDWCNQVFSNDFLYKVFQVGCGIFVWNYKLYNKVCSFFEKKVYTEPFDPYWVNYLTLDYNGGHYKNKDIYYILQTLESENIQTIYDVFCEEHNAQINMDHPDKLIIIKKEGYICRNWFPKKTMNDFSAVEPVKPSKVEFLFMEYNHPDMSGSIELEIPCGMYNIGNELLSASFVLRLLEKQNQEYVFDNRYELVILDEKMHRFTLQMNQYVLLEEDVYVICENDFIKEHLEYVELQKEFDEQEEIFFPYFYVILVSLLSDFLNWMQYFMPTHNEIKRIVNDMYTESDVDDESSEEEGEGEEEGKTENKDNRGYSSPDSFELVSNVAESKDI